MKSLFIQSRGGREKTQLPQPKDAINELKIAFFYSIHLQAIKMERNESISLGGLYFCHMNIHRPNTRISGPQEGVGSL